MADDLSWDDEGFEVPPVAAPSNPTSKGPWDEEEEEEEDVKASWEDSDEKKPAKAPPTIPKKDKKGKEKAAAPPPEEPLDPLAEKLRQQREVEESDLKNAKELFGQRKDAKNIDEFVPKSEADFVEYADLVADKVLTFEKSFHYMTVLKQLVRVVAAPLSGAQAKELSSVVSVLANAKLKEERDAVGAKKKATKKKQLTVERDDAFEESRPGKYGGDGEDFDFM